MEDVISKELLSEVLGFNIDYIAEQENTHISWHDEMGGHTINIHELAFRTRDYFKTKSKHLTLNQSIEEIFKEATSIYESLSNKQI